MRNDGPGAAVLRHAPGRCAQRLPRSSTGARRPARSAAHRHAPAGPRRARASATGSSPQPRPGDHDHRQARTKRIASAVSTPAPTTIFRSPSASTSSSPASAPCCAAPAAAATRGRRGSTPAASPSRPGLREVRIGADMVQVTSTEYELLEYLVRHAGRIVPRDELMAVVCQREASSLDRSLDVHVSRLRRKLADRASTIRTVRGVGYMFGVAAPADVSPSHFLRRATRPNSRDDVQISRGLLMPGTFAGAFHRGQVSCALSSFIPGRLRTLARPSGLSAHTVVRRTPMRRVSRRTVRRIGARWRRRCPAVLAAGQAAERLRRGSTARGC